MSLCPVMEPALPNEPATMVVVATRVPPAHRAELERRAADRRWSLSSYVAWLVEQHLDEVA